MVDWTDQVLRLDKEAAAEDGEADGFAHGEMGQMVSFFVEE